MTGLPTIGMILPWALNIPPDGWALCNGQTQPTSGSPFSALFSVIKFTYGGNNSTTFALPDMRGCTPIGAGFPKWQQTQLPLGAKGGTEAVTLNINQLPAHTHSTINQTSTLRSSQRAPASILPATIPGVTGSLAVATSPSIDPNTGSPYVIYNYVNNPLVGFDCPLPNAVTASISDNGTGISVNNSGGGLPHENRQPFIVMNFIICYSGVLPSYLWAENAPHP